MYTREELHVERIKPDTSFMEENLVKVKLFFKVAVLPELLGRCFSRPPERISMNNCESLPNSVPACFETITIDSSSPTTSGANPGDIEPIPTLIVLACMELTNTASKVKVGR